MPDIIVQTTEVTVCALPIDHPDADAFFIFVVYSRDGRWMVRRNSRYLGADGVWTTPETTSERWWETHRFDYDTALRLAVKAAPDVTCNGHRASDVAEASR